MTRISSWTTLLVLTIGICLFSEGPTHAEDLDNRIKALEQELTILKEQQVELKKEATAATAALSKFEYRPGNGLDIEAADKAWGLRFTVETHFRYLFEAGLDQQGRTQGELMGRRFRPGVFYCINNCLWEIEAALDMVKPSQCNRCDPSGQARRPRYPPVVSFSAGLAVPCSRRA